MMTQNEIESRFVESVHLEKRDNLPVVIRTPQMDMVALFNATLFDNMIVLEHNGESTTKKQIEKYPPESVGVLERTCKVLYQGHWSDGTLVIAVRFDYYARFPEKRPTQRFFRNADEKPKGDCGGMTVGEYFGIDRQMHLGECEHLRDLDGVARFNSGK